jgi:hypothetical protein
VPEQHQQPGDREAAAAYLAEMTVQFACKSKAVVFRLVHDFPPAATLPVN